VAGHPLLHYYGANVGFLLALLALCGLFLGLVSALTAPKIAQAEAGRLEAAMTAVIPGGEVDFVPVTLESDEVDQMQVAYQYDLLRGYCVQVTTDGFCGEISMMVGIDARGYVTGVVILDHRETEAVGAQVAESAFLGRFRGRSDSVKVGPGGVEAVSGATVSSQAVGEGVNRALAFVSDYLKGGDGV